MKIIYNDGHVDECPADDELHVIRHTAAHILAQAVKHLYPQAHFAYGPATEKGFHYDVDLGDVKLSDEDLKTIEKEMQAIVKQNLPIKPFALGREEAIKLMQERGEIYKVEHIGDLPEDATLTFYQQGDYIDMCVGPHLCYTKALKAFKLTALSGAYWKNDKNNKMLTRIGGIAFRNQEELNEYLKMMEEAEKRDHRKIGKEMGLFMLCDEGPGFPFFLPKGMQLKNALIDYWRDIHYAADYVEVSTPMIMSRHLWETSGHWDHYKDNMYSTKIDDEDYCIKPMNCPGGVMVYRSQPHSYRDLPLRVGELGLVHRAEGCAARSVPRPLLHAGRCPYLHDPRADSGRNRRRRTPHQSGVLQVRLRLFRRTVHPSGGFDGFGRGLGGCDQRPQNRAGKARYALHRQRGRRRVLRPED